MGGEELVGVRVSRSGEERTRLEAEVGRQVMGCGRGRGLGGRAGGREVRRAPGLGRGWQVGCKD